MAEDVGGIVWTADINTARLTDAERRINKSTRNADRSFRQAGKGADTFNREIDKTSGSAKGAALQVRRLATAVASAMAVRQVVSYAEAWTNVQNQLRVVTDSQEDLESVSSRLIGITKETRASLEGTAKLYSRFRRGVDDTVISDERLLGVTRTINQALAVSGATAQESEGALRQLAQGMASGALRGEEFNSVSEQAPGILRAVSQETGMAVGELREFAATGGITSELLIKSLENYADTADREFSSSTRTMSQSLEVARTNAIEFVGATNLITGAVGKAGDGVVFLSENLDTLVQLATVGATIFGARFVGAMASSTAAYVANAAAAFDASTENQKAAKSAAASAQAETARASAAVRSTQAVLAQLVAERNLEQVRLKAQINDIGRTKSLSRLAEIRRAESAITAQLTAQQTALTAATQRQTAAQAKANTVAAAGTAAMRGLRSVMGLLGGPGGVIFLAAAGLYAYATRAEEAKSANEILSQSTDDLTKAKARLARLDAEETLAAEEKRLADLERQIESATARWMEFGKGSNSNKAAQKELGQEIRRMRAELASGEEDAEGLRERLGELADVIAGETSPEMDNLKNKAEDAGAAVRNVWAEIERARENVRAGLKGGDDPFDIPTSGGDSGGKTGSTNEPDPGDLGLTRLQQLESQYDQERQMLLDAQQAGIDSKVSYESRLTELQRQYSEQRQELMRGESTGMIAALDSVGFSFEQMANRGVGAAVQVAAGMQDGEQAAKSFAMTLVTDMLGALVRLGLQAVTSTLMASGAEQTAKATSVATTGAAMAATTATTAAAAAAAAAAWTAPATLASIATLGGAAGIGTAAVGTALAAGQAMTAASQATNSLASAAGSAIGGGRLYGGQVNPGTMYPVSEDGKPELLTANGKQYLLPGTRGDVTSNREMTQQGGGNITVQQTINAEQSMDAQRFRNMVYDSNVRGAIVDVVERHQAKRGRRL